MSELTATGADVLAKLATLRQLIDDPKGYMRVTFAFAEYVGKAENRYFSAEDIVTPESFAIAMQRAIIDCKNGKNVLTGMYVDEAVYKKPPAQYGFVIRDFDKIANVLFAPAFAEAVKNLTVRALGAPEKRAASA